MFLGELNEEQKKTFLVLASRITQADGEDSADEHEALEEVCAEMEIPLAFDQRAVLGDIDVAAYDTHRSRVIAGLELMRFLYADAYVHEAEVAEIRAICRALQFPEPWIATMTEWAKRLAWAEEDPLDSQRAQYHAELMTFADKVMQDTWR